MSAVAATSIAQKFKESQRVDLNSIGCTILGYRWARLKLLDGARISTRENGISLLDAGAGKVTRHVHTARAFVRGVDLALIESECQHPTLDQD